MCVCVCVCVCVFWWGFCLCVCLLLVLLCFFFFDKLAPFWSRVEQETSASWIGVSWPAVLTNPKETHFWVSARSPFLEFWFHKYVSCPWNSQVQPSTLRTGREGFVPGTSSFLSCILGFRMLLSADVSSAPPPPPTPTPHFWELCEQGWCFSQPNTLSP